MAFEEYDDFEQEQLVKNWIKNNWLTIALGIGLGLGGVYGLNYWKGHQQQQRFDMAEKYKSFTEVMELSEFDEAHSVIKDMESESGNSFYTIEAHFLLAKEFVGKGELEKAAVELKSVVDNKHDQLITEFARLRLARVYNAMEKHDEALSQVQNISIESFMSIANEVQGDAYLAQDNIEKAQKAYKDAVEKGEGYSGKKNIEMKLENS